MKNTKISLLYFLKTYTAVSYDFIDEYYKFYVLCEKNNFGINLDLVIEYLEINKREKFYARFRDKYILFQDYIIIETNNKRTKGNKLVNYFINLDTFERICLSSHAKKANHVRDYFIVLRKFISYYKNNYHDMIMGAAKKDPNKCIYIIIANKSKHIFKVGKVTKNVRERLKQYVTGKDEHPDIKYIMLVDDPKQVEDCVKTVLRKVHYKGTQEIYKINISDMKNIIFNCATMMDNINSKYNNDNSDCYVIFDDNIDDNIDNNKKGYMINKIVNNIGKKSSRRTSRKISKKTSRKGSRKPSRKASRKPSKKISRKGSRKTSN